MLFGLALWVGLGVATLLILSVFERHLEPHLDPDKSREVQSAVLRRLQAALYLAVVLVIVALAARVVIDRAAPPTGLVVPVAIMTMARLLSAWARLASVRQLLLSLEVCLSLYALYAVS